MLILILLLAIILSGSWTGALFILITQTGVGVGRPLPVEAPAGKRPERAQLTAGGGGESLLGAGSPRRGRYRMDGVRGADNAILRDSDYKKRQPMPGSDWVQWREMEELGVGEGCTDVPQHGASNHVLLRLVHAAIVCASCVTLMRYDCETALLQTMWRRTTV